MIRIWRKVAIIMAQLRVNGIAMPGVRERLFSPLSQGAWEAEDRGGCGGLRGPVSKPAPD